jgi:FtsH-binding integral membrane protein
MAEGLVTAHSIVRWFVILGLFAAVLAGFTLSIRKESWSMGYQRIVTITVGLIDLQVLLGILVWVANKGWELDHFLAYIHPLGMIAAAVVAHITAARLKKQPASAFGPTAGLFGAMAIVLLLIPRGAWF